MRQAIAFAFAALPFAFGAIRAAKTGSDLRYLWVALAAGIGGFAILQLARTRPMVSPPVLAALAFVASTAAGIGAAMVLGTRLGPGILVVAVSFAVCFAAACLVMVLSGAAPSDP